MKEMLITRYDAAEPFCNAPVTAIDEIQWLPKWSGLKEDKARSSGEGSEDTICLREAEAGSVAASIGAKAQICYDEEALYVRLSAHEIALRKEESGPLGEPCSDSCLEFFFSPVEGDERYFNIEVNPAGCYYLGIGTSIETLVRLRPELHPDLLGITVSEEGNDWSVTYRVPLSFIRLFFPECSFAPGKTIRLNLFHCGDKTVLPHFLAWNPIGGKKISYHQPAYFGKGVLQ